uniref:Estrogen sulfotransferase, testis isoform n=2 Tax=Bactrocera latifrons TaxID=174628 RepID=A0A0K8VZS8_BACLA
MQNKCKVIYVLRNPEDVAVSYYHLNRLFRTQGYIGDFQRFWDYFSRGLNPWLPYYSHISEALEHRHLSNVLILNYEDMVSDLGGVVLKLAAFLNRKISAEGLKNLIQHLDIKNFRDNPSVNGSEMADVGVLLKGEAGFVRKGGNGKREELLNETDLKNRMDQWIHENMAKINIHK